MPNLDRTGPLGQGPVRGTGRGTPRGRRAVGRRQNGTKECTCPNCGNKESNPRGIPCTQIKCSKCGTPLKGVYCS
jgi:uncharacterized protein